MKLFLSRKSQMMLLTCSPAKQLHKTFLLLFFLGIFFLSHFQSSAYELNEYINWRQEEIVLETAFPILPEPLIDGRISWNEVIQAAANEWNYYLNAIGAKLKFVIKPMKTIPQDTWDFWINKDSKNMVYNKINNVFFSLYKGRILLENDTLAFCAMDYNINSDYAKNGIIDSDYNVIKEADIIFNVSYKWNSYRAPEILNETYDFYRIALHEMGHALGLMHADNFGRIDVKAIMHAKHVFELAHLQQDDIDGVAAKLGLQSVPVVVPFPEATPIVSEEPKQGTHQQTVSMDRPRLEKRTKRFAKLKIQGIVTNLKFAPKNSRIAVVAAGKQYSTVLQANDHWVAKHVRLDTRKSKHFVWAYVIDPQGHILAQKRMRVRIFALK